jgi:predicted metal-dependent phosphoesterase TrpH
MRWPFRTERSPASQDFLTEPSRKFSGSGEAELKADFHIHTGEDPEDRISYSATDLIDRAVERGFEVLSITNHNVITWDEDLAQYAERRGILLIPGVERTVHRKHVLVINAGPEDLGAKSFRKLARLKGDSKLIIAPHPFFPGINCLWGDLLRHISLFDAIEYSHYYTSSVNFNRKAVDLARQCRIPLVGTSDAHMPHQFGTTYTMIRSEKNLYAVIQAVRAGRVRIVSSPLSLSDALKIRLSMSVF